MSFRIVSGGQTGVDRGALDAAMELGTACGGWCPEGRAAENGPIPRLYPVRTLPRAGYADRTRRNVADSDGTLVILFTNPGDGTHLTVRHARRLGKPLLIIRACEMDEEQAAGKIREFVNQHGIRTLNVAGPRASGAPGAYAYSKKTLMNVLQP
jgi:hypothetical protein